MLFFIMYAPPPFRKMNSSYIIFSTPRPIAPAMDSIQERDQPSDIVPFLRTSAFFEACETVKTFKPTCRVPVNTVTSVLLTMLIYRRVCPAPHPNSPPWADASGGALSLYHADSLTFGDLHLCSSYGPTLAEPWLQRL